MLFVKLFSQIHETISLLGGNELLHTFEVSSTMDVCIFDLLRLKKTTFHNASEPQAV